MPGPDAAVLVGAVLAALLLLQPRLRRSDRWRATVTPLASIIGSGFLVLAPLLLRQFGAAAPLVMAALCAAAYAVGGAVRDNIRLLDGDGMRADGLDAALESASSWALAFAYVISVAYYLNLFGSFALSLTPWTEPSEARMVTSAALLLIGVLGWRGGLRALERAESTTVAIKLVVIAGLLCAMAVQAWALQAAGRTPHNPVHGGWDALRLGFGLIVTVQGFETSRYLRDAYPPAMRIRTMREAQWLSTAIYLVYIGLASLVFTAADLPRRETAVIQATATISALLPGLLVVAALAAQFSAAVADTNGSGGLVQQMSRDRVPARVAFAGLATLALALTWLADVFQIISYASRAFAAYYALQCALAARLCARRGERGRAAWHGALALLMAAAAVLGLPAE